MKLCLPALASVLAFAASSFLVSPEAAADTAIPTTTPPVRSSYQTWTSLAAVGPIHGDLIAILDVHGRFYDDMHPSIVLVQPGIGYRFGHGLTGIVSYGFTPSWNDKREFAEEHRIFEQLQYETPIGTMKFIARARLEERFRPGSDVALRLRTLVRLNVPLGLPIPLQTVVWDELFFGLTRPAAWQPETIDQNWLFAGLGYPFSPRFRMDAGYLWQVVPRKDATTVHDALSVNGLITW